MHVVLLRISSHKSTMIQMVGRGLRKLDPRRYPGRVKQDCLVLDFGISLLTHGDADVRLRYKDDDKDPARSARRTARVQAKLLMAENVRCAGNSSKSSYSRAVSTTGRRTAADRDRPAERFALPVGRPVSLWPVPGDDGLCGVGRPCTATVTTGLPWQPR